MKPEQAGSRSTAARQWPRHAARALRGLRRASPRLRRGPRAGPVDGTAAALAGTGAPDRRNGRPSGPCPEVYAPPMGGMAAMPDAVGPT